MPPEARTLKRHKCRAPRRAKFAPRALFRLKETHLAGGEVIHAANQADLMLVEHLAEDGAAFADLLHDVTHVGFGYLVNKGVIL